jgi:arylsulfatase A-like enzyme
MVRSREWKLVHFLDADYGQLFDLRNDPEEMRNRWNDPDAEEAKRGLLDVLREWYIRSGVRTAGWAEDWR